MDYYDYRFGPRGRPLGEYAARLFMKIMKDRGIILFSDVVLKELRIDYNNIQDMLKILLLIGILEKVEITPQEYNEARRISKERNIPLGDVVHAILAKDNKAILISQDKHFIRLRDIATAKKPQDVQ